MNSFALLESLVPTDQGPLKMSPVSIESIASEVVHQICGNLDRNTLSNFALASKFCNLAANLHLFRSIHITIISRSKLQLDLDRRYHTLERASSFQYVRQLELDGKMPPISEDVGHTGDEIHASPRYGEIDHKEDSKRSMWAVDRDLHYPLDPDDTPPEQSLQDDSAWKPLANFLCQLPAVADLVYSCTNQFTPCLLEVLHRQHPQCRLHIRTFKFRSLDQQDTDPHEFALASSPCLYSINARYSEWKSNGTEDYHKGAVLRTMAVLAPNIKHVRMSHFIPVASAAHSRVWRTGTRRPWKGFSLDKISDDFRPAKLETLDLRDYTTPELLETWSKHIVFSKLRILNLRGGPTAEALGWAASKYTFSNLTTLSIDACSYKERVQDGDKYQILLDLFLDSLPPLRNLRARGHIQQNTLDTILERHGKSLRSLWLETRQEDNRVIFDATKVDKIQKYCPALEELTINPIPRSKGDAHETAIYKALGAISKLQRLTLTLDSSNFRLLKGDGSFDPKNSFSEDCDIPNEPYFDDLHRQLASNLQYRYLRSTDHIRDALINSALDETLARAIFTYISSRKPPHGFPLEYLRLHSSGGGIFGGINLVAMDIIKHISGHIGREWLLTWSPGDGSQGAVIARDVSNRAVEWEPWSEICPEERTRWRVMEPIPRKIWPGKEDGTGDWRNDWHSWPLADPIA